MSTVRELVSQRRGKVPHFRVADSKQFTTLKAFQGYETKDSNLLYPSR